ncbi:unnamed protein product [Prorocentrum cordatum]|uniref:Uncharacterized protein n=1 Tax=Prorocentrum cordatum TaxID=2364126 RepID=A0ABN9PTV4_9DINO|nr:unnamed protein product [Polarella glacialis]
MLSSPLGAKDILMTCERDIQSWFGKANEVRKQVEERNDKVIGQESRQAEILEAGGVPAGEKKARRRLKSRNQRQLGRQRCRPRRTRYPRPGSSQPQRCACRTAGVR